MESICNFRSTKLELFFFLGFMATILTVMGQTADYVRSSLGQMINTQFEETAPVISPDGKSLYYIRVNYPDNLYSQAGKPSQDIWFSEISTSGKWKRARKMETPFNESQYNGVCSITPDGKTLLVTGKRENGTEIPGFSFIRQLTEGWSTYHPVDIKNFEDFNLGNYYGGTLSFDGNIIIIYMSDCQGDDWSDLYVSFKRPNSTWTKPKLLPEPLSSGYDEFAPFLASDNKTIYFSSDRPGSFGSHDIFMSKRLDDTWDNWSEPVNLGSSVNTKQFDANMTIDASGEMAYYATLDGSIGRRYADIVTIKLKDQYKPEPILLLYGKVLNSKNREPIKATLKFMRDGGEVISEIRTDDEDGTFALTLPLGENLDFTIRAENHFALKNSLDLTSNTKYSDMQRYFLLNKIEVGEPVRLNNIFFNIGTAELMPSSYPELDQLVVMLEENSKIGMEIGGHTDNVGSDEDNLKLSAERAKSVMKYLISKKIAEERLTAKGFGESKPITSNDTEEGRTTNRRVEIIIK